MYNVTYKMVQVDVTHMNSFNTDAEAKAFIAELIKNRAWYVYESHSRRYGGTVHILNGQDVCKMYA